MPEKYYRYALIGIVSGLLSGLLGVGGAIIVVPSLVFFCSFSQKMAQGTSVCLMLPPIGLFAALEYWRAGEVDLVAAAVIIVFFMIASYFGSRIANKVNEVLLKKIFASVLFLIALQAIFS